MRKFIILAAALAPSLALAQTASPLVINPTIALPPAYRGAAPLLPDPASGGIKMPDSGRVMLTPSLAPPRTPESSMPADRRQDPVPALRLRLPL